MHSELCEFSRVIVFFVRFKSAASVFCEEPPEAARHGWFAPERWGAELIPLAIRMLRGKPVPQVNFVKYQLLTTKNVDLFYPLDTPRGERV